MASEGSTIRVKTKFWHLLQELAAAYDESPTSSDVARWTKWTLSYVSFYITARTLSGHHKDLYINHGRTPSGIERLESAIQIYDGIRRDYPQINISLEEFSRKII